MKAFTISGKKWCESDYSNWQLEAHGWEHAL